MFKFPLEAVLKVRIRKLEQAQLSLAEALRAVADLDGRILGLERERLLAKEEMATRSAQGIAADEFIVRRRHLNGMRVQARMLREELEGCRQVAAQRRLELAQSHKEKKMVDRLKEKAYEEYSREAKAREMKALDEFAVIGFARARRG